MLYITWVLLNLAILFIFFALSIRAVGLIRVKFGLFASIIFVFGLFSFGTAGKDNKGDSLNSQKTWTYASADSLDENKSFFKEVILEKTSICQYQLGFIYGQTLNGLKNVPKSAFSQVTGFTAGTTWKPSLINVISTNDNNRWAYRVLGVVEWKLLSLTLYSERKEYEGTVFIGSEKP